MKEFFIQVKTYGFKIALDNALLSFTKSFIGAKKITVVYKKDK